MPEWIDKITINSGRLWTHQSSGDVEYLYPARWWWREILV